MHKGGTDEVLWMVLWVVRGSDEVLPEVPGGLRKSPEVSEDFIIDD